MKQRLTVILFFVLLLVPVYSGWAYELGVGNKFSGHTDQISLPAAPGPLGLRENFSSTMHTHADPSSMDNMAIPEKDGYSKASLELPLAVGGSITGTVTSEDNGSPLVDIKVRLYTYNSAINYWQYDSFTTTDSDGQYDLGTLSVGSYRVGFRDDSGDYLEEYYDNAPDVNSATDITVTEGVPTPPVNAALASAGHISGMVIAEADGSPLSGIQVIAYLYNPTGYYHWQIVKSGETDGSGQYDLGGLVGGGYRVSFQDLSSTYIYEYFDNVWDFESATEITVIPGFPTQPVDAAMSLPAHITGTVTAEADGSPLSNIRVTAYVYDATSYTWNVLRGTDTDVNGQYDISGLAGNTYRVGFGDFSGTYVSEYYEDAPDVGSATDIPVTPGVITPPVNAALVEFGHISGTVTAENGGRPLSDIRVDVYVYSTMFEYWQPWDSTYTDSSGQYDIGGLTTDNYRVGFQDFSGAYLGEYYDDAADLQSATDIAVTAGQPTAPVNAALTEAGHISGMVTAEVNGDPLKDIAVLVFRYTAANSDWDYVNDDYTDQNGQYDVGGLTAGNYRVWFLDPFRNYLEEYYEDAPDVESATDVAVTPGVLTAPVNAALATAGRINGTITAEDDGSALSNIQVIVYGYSTIEASWQDIYLTYTYSNGWYDIGGLSTGNYRVAFNDESSTYLNEYYEDAPDLGSATDIAVTTGLVTTVDAALSIAGHITGTVTSAHTGEPLRLIDVTAYRYDTQNEKWKVVKVTSPNYEGQYDIGGLPAAIYRVGFRDMIGDYREEYYDDTLSVRTGTDIPVTPGTATPPVDAQLSLCEARYFIYLYPGWNMVSATINPYNPLLADMLASIEKDMVLLKDDLGQIYWPGRDIDEVVSWDPLEGYQIYMQNQTTLVVCGQPIDPQSSPIELPQGWSLVTYLLDEPLTIEQALTTIAGQLLIVKNGQGQVYWPQFNINQIGDMHSGEGYMLYLTEPGTLIYP